MAVFTMVVAAGCTTTSGGTPLPDPNSTADAPSSDEPSASAGGDPSNGAPKVENPLDVSQFEQNPCDALTPEQAQELKVPATGELEDNGFGKTCYWRNSETGGMVGLHFFSEIKGGLSSVYLDAESKDFAYFEPIEDIEGYPAAAYDTKVEDPTTSCSVAVGVTDDLSFTVQVGLSNANVGQKEPCEVTAWATGMVMKTMLEAA
jgi:hypothetical protein